MKNSWSLLDARDIFYIIPPFDKKDAAREAKDRPILVSIDSPSHRAAGEMTFLGEIVRTPASKVIMKTKIGGDRIVNSMASDQLPRIC